MRGGRFMQRGFNQQSKAVRPHPHSRALALRSNRFSSSAKVPWGEKTLGSKGLSGPVGGSRGRRRRMRGSSQSLVVNTRFIFIPTFSFHPSRRLRMKPNKKKSNWGRWRRRRFAVEFKLSKPRMGRPFEIWLSFVFYFFFFSSRGPARVCPMVVIIKHGFLFRVFFSFSLYCVHTCKRPPSVLLIETLSLTQATASHHTRPCLVPNTQQNIPTIMHTHLLSSKSRPLLFSFPPFHSHSIIIIGPPSSSSIAPTPDTDNSSSNVRISIGPSSTINGRAKQSVCVGARGLRGS